MKTYKAAVARERLAEALDEAARGVPVFIERKGVRYRISLERPARARIGRQPKIQILDTAVTAGRWTWDAEPDGLVFRDRDRR